MPPGVSPSLYVKWMALARERGVPTMLDASGNTLCDSIAGGPTLVKPNEDEVEQLLGWRPSTWEQTYAAGRELQSQGIETVVVSRGSRGAMALRHDEAYFSSILLQSPP